MICLRREAVLAAVRPPGQSRSLLLPILLMRCNLPSRVCTLNASLLHQDPGSQADTSSQQQVPEQAQPLPSAAAGPASQADSSSPKPGNQTSAHPAQPSALSPPHQPAAASDQQARNSKASQEQAEPDYVTCMSVHSRPAQESKGAGSIWEASFSAGRLVNHQSRTLPEP